MITKVATIVFILGLIYFLFIKKRNKKTENLEELVPCAKCGTFISTKEALISSGNYFCSKECIK